MLHRPYPKASCSFFGFYLWPFPTRLGANQWVPETTKVGAPPSVKTPLRSQARCRAQPRLVPIWLPLCRLLVQCRSRTAPQTASPTRSQHNTNPCWGTFLVSPKTPESLSTAPIALNSSNTNNCGKARFQGSSTTFSETRCRRLENAWEVSLHRSVHRVRALLPTHDAGPIRRSGPTCCLYKVNISPLLHLSRTVAHPFDASRERVYQRHRAATSLGWAGGPHLLASCRAVAICRDGTEAPCHRGAHRSRSAQRAMDV